MTPKSAEKVAPMAKAPLKKKPSRGRVIAGVVAIAVILVVIVGGVAYWTLTSKTTGGKAVATTSSSTKATPAAASGEASSSAASTTQGASTETPLSETFTFRNVFRPTVKATYAESTSDGSTTTTATTSADGNTNTLYLISTALSPSKLATIRWNGTTYSLSEGSQVSTSPWRVEAVYSNSALMLYGDTQVTVTVGQGISK